MTAARYHIRHETRYDYDQPVGESHHLLRLKPRNLLWQRCLSYHLDVQPAPSLSREFTDNFGNRITALHFEADHGALTVLSESWVEVTDRPAVAPEPAAQSWESVRDSLRYQGGRRMDTETLSATAFLFESTDIRIKRSFALWARDCFTPGRPLLEATDALMKRIYSEFTFDPEATEVSTPVTEVFSQRRGVCQDFAHVMISCLRSLGLAARYVSGYLLTRPPPGKKRLVGADATHAWVSVYLPGCGWLDFDPTNGLQPAEEHIVIGWGRDFADVTPLRGVLLGGGGHAPDISVTVAPEADFRDLYADEPLPPALTAPEANGARRPG
jgi:transglutaminase-like putative cysteine protease